MKTTLLCSDFWLDILYPMRCPCCDKVIAWNQVICGNCESDLPYIREMPWQALFPAKINGKEPSFDYANALFWYKDGAKNAVLALKKRNAVKFAKYSAERLVLKLEDDELGKTDIITAVPMHRKKVRSRGYNQAEIFAEYLAAEMKLPCNFDLLKRKRSDFEQHSLGKDDRFAAAEEMYYSEKDIGELDGKTVLLCDDIFTSGATVDKCSALLKRLGAKKVYVVTICRTPPHDKKTSDNE